MPVQTDCTEYYKQLSFYDDIGWYEDGEDMPKHVRYFVGDFETTVYENQDKTEVWASAVVEFFTEDVEIHHSIEQTFNYLIAQNDDIIIYYHNLKFDGAFWLNYLINNKDLKQAINYDCNGKVLTFKNKYEYENNEYGYVISDMGQWYKIIIKINNNYIEIRDSLKLLPFTVKRIGESFGTKHKKLTMEYTGNRYAGCVITDEEKSYIANDVLVVKEALEIMFNQGHKKLTIGSCCLDEYRSSIGMADFKTFHPNIFKTEIDNAYGAPNLGEYVRKSYRGGWCYLVAGKARKVLTNGTTADVNSLYPSMMSSESGNIFPVGNGRIINFKNIVTNADAYISEIIERKEEYCFIRLRTRFYLKNNKLPFISIKGNVMYPQNQSLYTSDIYNKQDGKYYKFYIDKDGNRKEAIIELTLTQTDYVLFKEHYNLTDTEYLDCAVFNATTPADLFDRYISKYKDLKMKSKGAIRELAKLFLNNLYGKMASSTNSSFKVATLKEDGSLGFVQVESNDKEPGYIPIGSAITSYARNFTIRAAQMNFYGADKRGFVYADTDSIHCDLQPDEIKGITIDDKKFCCWKLESCWDYGWFVRAKTYIEHIKKENMVDIEEPYLNIKCAGMPDRSKELFIHSMQQDLTEEEIKEYKPIEQEFIRKKRELSDFDIGLIVPSKLIPKQIKGGVLLCDSFYEMRNTLLIRY